MTPEPKALEWGCPACNFWLSPSTLPTNYRACPMCSGPVIAREPKAKPAKGKGAADPTDSLMYR